MKRFTLASLFAIAGVVVALAASRSFADPNDGGPVVFLPAPIASPAPSVSAVPALPETPNDGSGTALIPDPEHHHPHPVIPGNPGYPYPTYPGYNPTYPQPAYPYPYPAPVYPQPGWVLLGCANSAYQCQAATQYQGFPYWWIQQYGPVNCGPYLAACYGHY